MTLTAPLNSRSIRLTSSVARRRLFPVRLITVSTDRLAVYGQAKSSCIADRYGEVAGLRVERAAGIQSRSPPPLQLTPKCTSWRLGKWEKSKDRSKASRPSISGVAAASIFRALCLGCTWRTGETYGRRRPCTRASQGSCYTLLRASQSRGDTRSCFESAPR